MNAMKLKLKLDEYQMSFRWQIVDEMGCTLEEGYSLSKAICRADGKAKLAELRDQIKAGVEA